MNAGMPTTFSFEHRGDIRMPRDMRRHPAAGMPLDQGYSWGLKWQPPGAISITMRC